MMRGVNLWQIQSQLLVAIQYGDIERCAALLAAGADCDQTFQINSQTRPAICLGVERGAYPLVELLIRSGVAINRRDSRGCTCLHVSSEMGYDKISELLLKNRADVNAADNLGVTPLHIAAKRGAFNFVQTLISHGADLNRKDHAGKSPLAYACSTPNVNTEVIDILLANDAFADDMDSTGYTPLLCVLLTPNFQFDTIKALISQGARVDLVSRDGKAPIHIVLQSKNPSKWNCLDLLLKSGCNINLCNHMGQSAVHIACLMNDIESLKILLRANSNPNTVDRLGISPLSFTVTTGLLEFAHLLIDGGAVECVNSIKKWDTRQLTEVAQNNLTKRLGNPLKLTEISKIALCKRFGPFMADLVTQSRNEIPSSLLPFLLFEEPSHNS